MGELHGSIRKIISKLHELLQNPADENLQIEKDKAVRLSEQLEHELS